MSGLSLLLKIVINRFALSIASSCCFW